MPEDSHLTPEHRVFADLGAAADTILGDDNAVFTNDDVVGDLHEVVDLGAFADEGVAECAAINSAVGPDLDVVLDHDAADLRDFAVMILIKNITVAIGADDGAGVNADTVADPALRVNCDVGKQAHRLAKHRLVADGAVGLEHRLLADGGTFADDAVRADVRRAGDLG